MATGTANPNYHGQLVAATPDSITLSTRWKWINVINCDGTSRIDFTIDGSTPVVNGGQVNYTGFLLPASIGEYKVTLAGLFPSIGTLVVVKLISAGTPRYAIIGGQ